MAMTDTAVFSYISGTSPFHRLSAEIKVLLLLVFPPLLFLTNIPICLFCMFLFALFSRFCGIKFKMQFRDIKPILIYSFFLLTVGIFSALFTYFFGQEATAVDTSLFISSIPSKNTQLLILHLICTMQFTSLFFKTTTSLALKEALENIEKKITFGKSSCFFSQTFSLFINFIPTVFSVWRQIELSWIARGGKNGFSKYTTLLPVFISVSLQKAYKTYLALENRK
jgi:energy-coupling factor transporter transmembrane protein EcfT